MGKRIARLSWAWLTTLASLAFFCETTAYAEDNGVAFRMVAVNCAKVGPESVCLTAPLGPESAATALDVLRDIYPALGTDGTGQQFAGADPVEAASDPDAGAAADRKVDLTNGDSADIAVVDAGALAYAAAVSSGVVAVAQIKPAYKPLGRLQVATDPGGPTDGYRLLLAGPDSPVVVTVSSHFNTGEQYQSFQFTGVVDGELVDLYAGPYLYALDEPMDDCDFLDRDEAVNVLKMGKKSHHGLADLNLVIGFTAKCVKGEAGRQVAKKSFPLRLIYDGKRYNGNSSPLDDFNSSFME